MQRSDVYYSESMAPLDVMGAKSRYPWKHRTPRQYTTPSGIRGPKFNPCHGLMLKNSRGNFSRIFQARIFSVVIKVKILETFSFNISRREAIILQKKVFDIDTKNKIQLNIATNLISDEDFSCMLIFFFISNKVIWYLYKKYLNTWKAMHQRSWCRFWNYFYS